MIKLKYYKIRYRIHNNLIMSHLSSFTTKKMKVFEIFSTIIMTSYQNIHRRTLKTSLTLNLLGQKVCLNHFLI